MTTLSHPESTLPPIPNKRYFTIGEVGSLCDVKSHVLRYWEQEFTQLKPTKRRGNRRYYQRHDIELIRLIRSLLYEQGFTIAGARQQLDNVPKQPSGKLVADKELHPSSETALTMVSIDEPISPKERVQGTLAEDDHDDELTHLIPLNPDSGIPALTQIRQALEQISRNIKPLL